MPKAHRHDNCLHYRRLSLRPIIIHKVLSHLDKHGSYITANSARVPPFEAAEQTTVFDDFTFQRDFDFGA
jgi:hypothetical protein